MKNPVIFGARVAVVVLVVAVVVGIIAFVFLGKDDGIVVAVETPRADYGKSATRVKEDMRLVAELVAQAQRKGTLRALTSNICSDCVCRDSDLRNAAESSPCMAGWLHVLDQLRPVQEKTIDVSRLKRDQWGSPYALDENQGEGEPVNCKAADRLRSVGPDGIWGTVDDIIEDLPVGPVCP